LAKTKPKKQNVKYCWLLSVDVIMDRKKWRGRGEKKRRCQTDEEGIAELSLAMLPIER
jgi:hypothetical protein